MYADRCVMRAQFPNHLVLRSMRECKVVDDCVRCANYIDERCIYNSQVIYTSSKVSYYES